MKQYFLVVARYKPKFAMDGEINELVQLVKASNKEGAQKAVEDQFKNEATDCVLFQAHVYKTLEGE